MALDPNIILQGQQPQVNPLQMAGQAAALQNQLMQNRSNQQQLAARQAIGPIYQQSIDPNTGQLDTNKLLATAAANPDTAWMAGDLVKSAQDRQAQQVQIDQSQLSLAKDHLATATGMLAPLLTNPNLQQSDVIGTMADAVAQKLVTPQEAMQEVQGLPTDPAGLHQYVLSHYLRYKQMGDQIGALYGTPQQTNTGNAIQQGTESAVTGYHPQGSFQVGLSPSDAAATVATVGPNGQPGVISKGTYAAQQGIPQGGAYTPANGQPMPPGASSQGSLTGAASTVPGAPAGFMPTGLAPGQAESMQAAATDNTVQGQALLKQANDTQTNVIPLIKEAKSQLAVGGVSSGPGAPIMKSIGALASQMGVNFDAQGTASQEVAEKVLEQLAGRQSTILAGSGANTDAKLNSAQASTPNIHMSPLGLQGALATVEGNANAITLRGSAYQAYLNGGGSPANFNKFANTFNQRVDPFVLQVRALPPAEQAQVFKTMSPSEHQKFNQSAAFIDTLAQKTGWQP